jgi:hypothetical protein
VGAIGDTDDERVDTRGHCDAIGDFRGIGQNYPRKGPAEQLTVDSMNHLGAGADVFTGAGTIMRPQQSGAPVGFASQP